MFSAPLRFLVLTLVPILLAANPLASSNDSYSNDGATITGAITIEAGKTQQRVYRGRAYRGGTAQKKNEASSTPNKNTIISAHPLSFDVEIRPLPRPVRIRQENATFIPKITPVTVGSTVQFVNDDPFYHNVFSLTPGAKFNIGRRPTGAVVSQKVPRLTGEVEVADVGEIQLFCDIHSQMNAQILSLDTPYFIRVDEDGTYILEGLPAGRYQLRAYNPDFETVTAEITLTQNEQAIQDFNLSK